MKFYGALCAFLAILPLICAAADLQDVIDFPSRQEEVHPSIVKGEEVKPHSFPHQVALVSRSNVTDEETLCGGTLISNEWVITAANCTEFVKDIFAVLGVHNMSADEESRQKIKVVKIFRTDKWKGNYLREDIALLKLESPADLNEYVQPLRLSPRSEQYETFYNKSVLSLGWGKFSDASGYSEVLKSFNSTVMSLDDCNYRHIFGTITWAHFCTDTKRGRGGGECLGDGGGPLIISEGDGKHSLLGVFSYKNYRYRSCDNYTPAVYTRVDYYLDWIQKITGLAIRD